MPLKRADHHHVPTRTFWKDGRDGVLFTMEDAEVESVDPIRCFVTRHVLDRLRGDVEGDVLAIFKRGVSFWSGQRAANTTRQASQQRSC